MSSTVVGKMVIEFRENGTPTVDFEGIVDVVNMQSLMYTIRTEYDLNYIMPRRDEEVKHQAERKEQVKSERELAEKHRLQAIVDKKKTVEEALAVDREIQRKKKMQVQLENQKIEAERTIRRESNKSTDKDIVSNAQKALIALDKELEEFHSVDIKETATKEDIDNDREEGKEGRAEGIDTETSTGDIERSSDAADAPSGSTEDAAEPTTTEGEEGED